MVRKDHYDQIDNSNNQYAKLKILFPTLHIPQKQSTRSA